jgi:hypothetical protein
MDGWFDATTNLINQALIFLKSHWWAFLNSVFFTALLTAIVGSCAGAFAGARAAQRIADKTRNRDELLKQIRATNAAVMLAFGICNNLLSLKKQHVKPLKEKFDQDKASIIEALKMQKSGAGGEVHFLADFRGLSHLDLPISLLQEQIFEKISVHGGAILLTTAVAQTVRALNLSIKERNNLIENFKARSLPVNELVALYFGFRFGERTNEQYPNTIDAIYRQTDDAIFYSWQLCDDLSRHRDQLAASFEKRFGKGAPRIHKPDFSKAVEADLMPNESDYADWMSMFAKRR